MGDMEMAELGGSADEGYAQMTRQIPPRRAADATEIAAVVTFLLSDAASFMNGSVVTADGGRSMSACWPSTARRGVFPPTGA